MKSFKQYLTKLEEDATTKAAEIDAMLANIDTQIAKLTKPLNDKKVLLSRQKASLLPQIEQERAAAEKAQSSTTQPQGSSVTTPGSAGAQTPGQPG